MVLFAKLPRYFGYGTCSEHMISSTISCYKIKFSATRPRKFLLALIIEKASQEVSLFIFFKEIG